jgi:hypothetical protein
MNSSIIHWTENDIKGNIDCNQLRCKCNDREWFVPHQESGLVVHQRETRNHFKHKPTRLKQVERDTHQRDAYPREYQRRREIVYGLK